MSKSDIRAKAAGAAKAKSKFGHYGDGCDEGHERAQEWLANPNRGNPAYGGTLQLPLLEFADRLRRARSQNDGLIVGFCYAAECPIDAAACQAVSHAREEVGHG